jgi:F-type H+-transporting ATPase subunit b
MLRRFLTAVALGSALALAVPAVAAPAETHTADAAHAGDAHGEKVSVVAAPKQGIASSVTALVVFAIVLGILSTAVWPKITTALEARNAKIRDEIESAEAARRQARDALEEYERSLAQARAEAQKMLDDTRAQQTKLAAELKAKADADLAEMRLRATADIEAAKKAALAEIYESSVSLATSMASKILRREISAQDQRQLVEESLAELHASRN